VIDNNLTSIYGIEETLHDKCVNFTNLSNRMGHDCNTVFINGFFEAKIFGARDESVKFRIRSSKNKTTAAKATTTRFAIVTAPFDIAEIL